MTRNALLSLFVLGILAPAAEAQVNPGTIELACYGGRNQMGLHVCACDQGWISGSAALILGNSVQLYGPGTLDNCLSWADGLNGADTSPPNTPITPPNVPAQPPKPPVLGSKAGVSPPATTKPETPPSTPPKQEVRIPPIEETDACATAFNACLREGSDPEACVTGFNACNDDRIRREREAALLEEILKNDTWFGVSRVSSDLPSREALTQAMFSGAPIFIDLDCKALRLHGLEPNEWACNRTITTRWKITDVGSGRGNWVNCYRPEYCRNLNRAWTAETPPQPMEGPYIRLFLGVIVELTPDGEVLTKVAKGTIRSYADGRAIGSFSLDRAAGNLEPAKPPAPQFDCPPGSTDMLCEITGPGAAMSNGNP